MDTNIVVFSATDSATEARQDASLRHGIFTYALAEGLNGKADLMKKGAVNITGLFNFVSSEVYDLSKGEQEPTFCAAGVKNFSWRGPSRCHIVRQTRTWRNIDLSHRFDFSAPKLRSA